MIHIFNGVSSKESFIQKHLRRPDQYTVNTAVHPKHHAGTAREPRHHIKNKLFGARVPWHSPV
eukprot:1784157-Alexandrium_andersonii.AAC.1